MPESELPESTTTTTATVEETPETTPEPEPWTPERVRAWNAYYDLYVAAGIVLLVFIVSATKITNPAVWALLQAGRQEAAQAMPVSHDTYSYTMFNQPWVNVPWLYEWGNSLVYQAIAPERISRQPGQMTQADQYASGALVAINAIVRVLTALLLLSLRRAGPGLWWAAVCTALALGGLVLPPYQVTLGGLAGQAQVEPETWGLFFLAAELFLLHRTLNLARRNAVVWLVPLFLLWANVDESFLYGLLMLAMAVLGQLQPPEPGEARVLTFRRGLVFLALSAAVCLINPSTYHVYGAALSPITEMMRSSTALRRDQLSIFGATLRNTTGPYYRWFVAFYLIVVGLGLGTFFLNRQRFSFGRFLTYLAAAALWGLMLHYRSPFALVLAMVLTLNGQEWYQDQFGTEGRLGRLWSIWSVGGRAITIIATCLFLVFGLTGYGSDPELSNPVFGFGVNPDLFPFEAADALRSAKIEGNVLNTSPAQGDALIWRAHNVRKTFIDSRQNLFPISLRNKFEDLRRALRDDDVEKWKPILDEYHITVVMLDPAPTPGGSFNTHLKLLDSPNWIRFYDDGNIVMFGRKDAKDPDLSYFKENELNAETLAYKRHRPVEAADRPPRMVTSFDRMFYDKLFQSRYAIPPQPHVESANRWLATALAANEVPDPAHCLMAVREARTALARRPDDPSAFRVLADSYRWLMLHESAWLAGKTLTANNGDQIEFQPNILSLRNAERATVLRYAIQTFPPPRTQEDTRQLANLHYELGHLYQSVNMFDLALEQFQAVLSLSNPDDVTPNFRTRVKQINEQVSQVQTRLASVADPAQTTPIQRAQFALSQGAVGMAIDELYEADQEAVQNTVVRPLLVDLYCQTGQPDKALDLSVNDDAVLNNPPGGAGRRQGLISFLVGITQSAVALWRERALPELRGSQAQQALFSGREFLRGDVRPATDSFLELPQRVTTESSWEMDLGLALLEGGEPDNAGEHLAKALTLWPENPARPVLKYYLEKLGKPVPPLPAQETATAPSETPAPSGAKEPDKNAKSAEQPAPAGTAAPENKSPGADPAAAKAQEPAAPKTEQPKEAPKSEHPRDKGR